MINLLLNLISAGILFTSSALGFFLILCLSILSLVVALVVPIGFVCFKNLYLEDNSQTHSFKIDDIYDGDHEQIQNYHLNIKHNERRTV